MEVIKYTEYFISSSGFSVIELMQELMSITWTLYYFYSTSIVYISTIYKKKRTKEENKTFEPFEPTKGLPPETPCQIC